MHHSIDNDGVQLAMSENGDGPDLLFVHGLGSAQVIFEPLVARLSDRYRCWNLDVRGHGRSDRAPGYYRPGLYASDAAAALDYIGRPTIAIGHSLGGMAVVRVAAKGHDLMRAVYALDSPVLRMPGDASSSKAIFERQIAMLREFQPADRPIDDYEDVLAAAPYVGGGTNRDHFVPSQLRGRAESLSQLDPECIEANLGGYVDGDPVPPALTIPFRLIAGDPNLGAAFRPEHAAPLRELSPQVEIKTMTGVGHQLMMVQGFDEKVALDLEDFLARHR